MLRFLCSVLSPKVYVTYLLFFTKAQAKQVRKCFTFGFALEAYIMPRKHVESFYFVRCPFSGVKVEIGRKGARTAHAQ